MRAFLFVVQWILIGLGVAVVALVAWPSGDPAGALAELRQRLHGVPARGYAEAVRRAAPAVVAVRAITRGAHSSNSLGVAMIAASEALVMVIGQRWPHSSSAVR